MASMRQPCPGSIYNVVDDNPAGRAEVMAFAAKLLGQEASQADRNNDPQQARPAQHTTQAGAAESKQGQQSEHIAQDSMQGAGKDSKPGKQAEKRVSNQKIKAELLVAMEFPSFVEGLSAIHRGDKRPFC